MLIQRQFTTKKKTPYNESDRYYVGEQRQIRDSNKDTDWLLGRGTQAAAGVGAGALGHFVGNKIHKKAGIPVGVTAGIGTAVYLNKPIKKWIKKMQDSEDARYKDTVGRYLSMDRSDRDFTRERYDKDKEAMPEEKRRREDRYRRARELQQQREDEDRRNEALIRAIRESRR